MNRNSHPSKLYIIPTINFGDRDMLCFQREGNYEIDEHRPASRMPWRRGSGPGFPSRWW